MNDCTRHPLGDLVVGFGSDVDAEGNPIADQCADCLDECEAATW